VRRQQLFEENWTESSLESRHHGDKFSQRRIQLVTFLEECGELGSEACFLATYQLDEYVFLARKVKEKRAVGDARRRRYRLHVGAGHSRTLELGERGGEYAFPCLASARVSHRGLDL
jgi:hypothetical protein